MTEQQQTIREFEEMGFQITSIVDAYQKYKGDKTQMSDFLIQQSSPISSATSKDSDHLDKKKRDRKTYNDDDELEKFSSREAGDLNGGFEPLDPEQRQRLSGMPVGLRNVGNTCYVNSLFQSHFQNYKFVKAVMEFEIPINLNDLDVKATKSGQNQDKKKLRLHASIALVKNLQTLFGMMIRSHKKYANPAPVLNMLVDDFANHIPVGDQKDVTEFNIAFLTRVEEALQQQDSFLKRIAAPRMNESLSPAYLDESMVMKSSLFKKLSTIGDAEETFMSNTFFGKLRNFRSYPQAGERVIDAEDSLFGSIILDVGHKDIYSSFDAWLNLEIEGFRAPNGEICKADKNGWITKAPDTLFFQLQRVVYNIDIGNVEKLNTPFYLEKEIYIDRFLLENKDMSTEIKHKVEILKNKLNNLEIALSKIQNHKKSGSDLISVLGTATDFLKAQLPSKPSARSKLNPLDPMYVGLIDDKETVIQSINTLGQYQQFLLQKKDELQREINKIKGEIDGLYSQLKKEKYVLGSILIHDGGAGSGHYYSFIRNNDNTWKRYNDIQVSDESEEVVFKEATGGKGRKSAYCAVYVSQKSLDEEAKHISAYKQGKTAGGNELEVPKQHYNALLKEGLRTKVERDNKLFHEEIEEFRFQMLMRRLTNSYEARLDNLNSSLSIGLKQHMTYYINSFGLFLKNEMKNDDLLKWYVLDTCLQEGYQNLKFKLRDLKNQPRLLRILQSTVSSLGKNSRLKELVLQKEEDQLLDTKLAEYIITIPAAIVCLFIFEKGMQEEWTETLIGVQKLNDMNFPAASYFCKINTNIAGVLTLYLAAKVELLMSSERFEEVEPCMNTLYALAKGILKQSDPQTGQAKAILNDTVAYCQDKISAEQMKKFNEHMFKLNNGLHVKTELDKTIGNNARSEELERRIAETTKEGFDPYKWQNVSETSYSNQIKRSSEKFISKYKTWVEFYRVIDAKRTPLKKEERYKNDFVARENIPVNNDWGGYGYKDQYQSKFDYGY